MYLMSCTFLVVDQLTPTSYDAHPARHRARDFFAEPALPAAVAAVRVARRPVLASWRFVD
jgi:hypothetical protein